MNRFTTVVSAGIIALAMSGSAWAASGAGVTAAQISAAKTAADHEAIAKAYDEEAADLASKAEMHQTMADAYKFGGKPYLTGQPKHCVRLVKELKAAAAETRALASDHHKLAKEAGK